MRGSRTTTHNIPVFFFVFLKEFFNFFPLEVSFILIVSRNGIILINAVILLGQKLLKGEHNMFGGTVTTHPTHHWGITRQSVRMCLTLITTVSVNPKTIHSPWCWGHLMMGGRCHVVRHGPWGRPHPIGSHHTRKVGKSPAEGDEVLQIR